MISDLLLKGNGLFRGKLGDAQTKKKKLKKINWQIWEHSP